MTSASAMSFGEHFGPVDRMLASAFGGMFVHPLSEPLPQVPPRRIPGVDTLCEDPKTPAVWEALLATQRVYDAVVPGIAKSLADFVMMVTPRGNLGIFYKSRYNMPLAFGSRLNQAAADIVIQPTGGPGLDFALTFLTELETVLSKHPTTPEETATSV